ncbi:flagellar assembly protein FliH [sulfur-oxidizing endosymbiont of Gigantopelta aegis]|uniref:flagellar assembly protein FliH n=1 Tax=sulfur-oxidizing endosymbiont of Gigantopelta aegis TaxID=2794934 RepID=UPI0018DAFCCA|nr:flagellar assembly protein FliH [sulfur-oxidizing endosymbiont of Gigantopelta aegis]
MSDSDKETKLSKVISADSQIKYQRLFVPSGKSKAQREKEQSGLMTARKLEALQKQAYDESFQQGKDEGYQAGLEEGRKEGLVKGQEEVAQIVKHFEQMIQFIATPIEAVNETVEEELVSLAIATAKQIIRREISVDPGQIIAVIKEALFVLPSSAKKIKVYLHPADAAIAREHLSSTKNDSDSYQEDESWAIIDEPNITRGGCEIKSATSQVDAKIETRIAEIAVRILGSERAGSERAGNEREESESVAKDDTLDDEVDETAGVTSKT